ncbi:restriction endonuclease subunit S [Lactobacillus delbrueckii subsp. bulgaricus]
MPGHARTGGRDVIFAWEQRKLGDVAKITAGGDINKGDLINKGKYPVIANGLNNNGIVGYSNKYKIDAPAVTITGRGTLGVATARFINFTPIVRLISIKSDLDPIYLENVINNTHFVIESTGVPQLTAPQVKRQTVILSNCHIEQTKIGSLFLTLDNAITLHEEKKRQLERLKSALLQKMFADKSGYPPVRFEGFSDKWEQVKYGEIFQRRSKMGVSTPTLPSVEYDDINPGMGTLNKEPKSKGISKRGIYFNPGDVLFGKLRPYLKNWLFACFEGVAVGDFWVLTSSKIDHGFTYSLIQTPGFQYIANLSSGSKMPRSDWGLVSNARTFIPINHLEQERISSVLFGLDHAITLYEHKLEILNKIKSFLLQNMFI